MLRHSVSGEAARSSASVPLMSQLLQRQRGTCWSEGISFGLPWPCCGTFRDEHVRGLTGRALALFLFSWGRTIATGSSCRAKVSFLADAA